MKYEFHVGDYAFLNALVSMILLKRMQVRLNL